MKGTVLKWELAGIIIIGLGGSLLHFVFEWSGGWDPIGAIAAVNESVWEHLKLAFWPALAYAMVEYPFLRRLSHSFASAKACGLYIMPATIVALFYAYTWVTGDPILALDILIFWVAVALGQLVSYCILVSVRMPRWVDVMGLLLIALLAAAFVVLSYYPPHWFIFRDPNTLGYGIPD